VAGKNFKEKYLGRFRISEKVLDKHSNMYSIHNKPLEPGDEPAPMRYWMRVGSTAQGFHHSTLFNADGPRHASHGCYRLSKASAKWLFAWTPVGTPVYVVDSIRDSRFAWLAGSHGPGKGTEEDASARGSHARATAARPKPARARVAATAARPRPRVASQRPTRNGVTAARPKAAPRQAAQAPARKAKTAGWRGSPVQQVEAATVPPRKPAARPKPKPAPPAARPANSASAAGAAAPLAPLQALLARVRDR
jgi:hypothetical protein